MNDMIPDPFACAETECHYLVASDLDTCEKERHCPFAFQRRREEDQVAREEKDRKMRPGAPGSPARLPDFAGPGR